MNYIVVELRDRLIVTKFPAVQSLNKYHLDILLAFVSDIELVLHLVTMSKNPNWYTGPQMNVNEFIDLHA